MAMDDLVERIKAAACAHDREAAAQAIDELGHRVQAEGELPDDSVATILKKLRGQRWFDEVQRVVEAAETVGLPSPLVRKHYAQTLIEAKDFEAAIAVLDEIQASEPETDQHSEALGLLGRTYKQMYVDRQEDERAAALNTYLRRSVSYYRDGFERNREVPDQFIWHGINLAAVLYRGEQDGVKGLGEAGEWRGIAEAVERNIVERGEEAKKLGRKLKPWDLATAGEAALALGRWKDAERWLTEYKELGSPFSLAGTARQLREVWRFPLDGTDRGGTLAWFHAEAVRDEDGAFGLDGQSVPQVRDALDQVIAQARLNDAPLNKVRWLLDAIRRVGAVVRIGYDRRRGNGTGFVVRASDLGAQHLAGDDEYVVLTNAHVITKDRRTLEDPNLAKQGLQPIDSTYGGVLTFEAEAELRERTPTEYRVEEIWSSPYSQLDTTLLRIPKWKPPDGFEPCPLYQGVPVEQAVERVYLIGHPGGEHMKLSLHGTDYIGWAPPSAAPPDPATRVLLHYASRTEPGSSGSPAFSTSWDVVGVHHAVDHAAKAADGSSYEANEAIWIQSISDAVKKAGGSP